MRNFIDKYLQSLKKDESLKTLSDIEILIKCHLSQLSFTSIPVLLNEDISVELVKVVEKVVLTKRGGYCFEHNKLMYEALLEAGFEVKSYLARVLLNRDIIVPKTHRFTILTYENEQYIVDVGFGYSSPNIPIKFGVVTTTSLGVSYKVEQRGENSYALGIVKEDGFYTLYSFEMNDYNETDYELGHFYSHKHSMANFVNNLVISRILEDRTLSLRNSNYQIIYANKIEEIKIDSVQKLEEILSKDFDYPLKMGETKTLFDSFCKVKR